MAHKRPVGSQFRYFILVVLVLMCMGSAGYLLAAAPKAETGETAGVPAPVTPATSAASSPPPVRVAAVGDSLLAGLESAETLDQQVGAAGSLSRGLETGGFEPVYVSGNPGYATSQLLVAVQEAVAEDPAAVVFVSGSNDAVDVLLGEATTPDIEAMVRSIRDALDEMSDVDCVVWPTVTTQVNLPLYWGTNTWAPRAVNETLRREATHRPNLHLVDWDDVSADHPAGSSDPWFLPDGLHHTAAGEHAFEALLLEGLAECLEPVPASGAAGEDE